MPFFFFTAAGARSSYAERIRHTILFDSENVTNSPDLITDLPRFHPLEFARAPNGYVYIASGLDSVFKWDGVNRELLTVGVIAPTVAPVIAATGAGDITGRYRAYLRFVDADGNVSNLSPVSNTLTADSNSTIVYTNVQAPTEDKVVRRQLLRNTTGQFLVFYVDVDTTDLSSSTFSSTNTDANLRNLTAVPLFDDSLSVSLADRFGIPPNDKPFIAFYQNRLWLYGEVPYEEGNVQVTFGSATVTGIGTEWTAEMANRLLYVLDADGSYLITSVDEDSQALTLSTEYISSSDKFAIYKIRPLPTRRHRLFYSEAGLYDSWPSTQGIDIASSDDVDDDGTGLVSTHSFLYIIQRRHIYRLSFLEDPAVDGGIFLSARRGCVNNRSWVSVDGWLYCLDDRGIYRFDGSSKVEDLSQPIQDLFYFDREPEDLRINWGGARFFHASHDRNDATIRWFVAFSGEYLPRHALCYNYSVPQWWIEEYPFAVGDSTIFKAISSIPLVAGRYRKVFTLQVGTLDLVDEDEGETRSDVSAFTRRSLTATPDVAFPPSAVVGAPVGIVDGRGKGQWRRIATVSGTTISLTQPWIIDPDTETSVFQIGGMPWRWRSGWSQWPVTEHNQARRISVGFQPTDTAAEMDLRVYEDYARAPTNWALKWPRIPSDSTGIETEPDNPDAELDLEQEKGFSYLTLDGFNLYDEFRGDIVSAELRGFSARSPVVIYQLRIQGAGTTQR
jgi:hypothetical protein